jgi:hypothetical protein
MFQSGGCLMRPAPQPTAGPTTARSTIDLMPPSTRPDAMEADGSSSVGPSDVDLVAEQAQRYSQRMAPALERRESATPPAAAQPSLVQWGDPSDTQLSLLPGYLLRAQQQTPAAAPVDASPSAANASAGELAAMRYPAGHPSATLAPAAQPPGALDTRATAAVPADQRLASDAAAPVAYPARDQTLAAMDARLSRRVQDYPNDVSAQFDYQLLQFVMDEPVPNLSAIASLPDEDREMIAAVMDGLSNYRNNLRADNNMLLSRKVRPLLDMTDRLRALSDLIIPTIALCQDVRGFGNYTPFDGDPPRFSAGSPHPTILYCEVANFSSQLNDKRLWQTELVQNAVLYTEGGMSVWTDQARPVTDTARVHRQDFFIAQRIDLPAALPIGRYLLKVTIEDKQSNHFAEATQPLLIIAQ